MRLLLLTLALALLAAGCGPLPRPFQEEEKQAIELRAPSTRAPLRVAAPAGDVPGNPERFSLLLAEALLEAGVAAEPDWFDLAAAPPLETSYLSGMAHLQPEEDGSERLALAWRLRKPDGKENGLTQTETLLPRGQWADGAPAALEAAAQVSAAAITRSLGLRPPLAGDRNGDQRGDGSAGLRRLVVLPIEGAPGDGAESLEQAIIAALREEEVALAGLPQERDLLLWCEVEVSRPQGAWQAVRIQWRVEKASDFSEVGTITQENQVPAGSLNSAWRDTASQIAQAAASGIVDLLHQAGFRPGPQL